MEFLIAIVATSTLFCSAETNQDLANRSHGIGYYLEERNPELVRYSGLIAKLPRYDYVLAIAQQETGMCTKGVGESKNNCGGIKSLSGGFQEYDNPMSGLEHISEVIHRPHLRDKTIDEMNGIYCQHNGGKCPNWTENIEKEKWIIFNAVNGIR